MGAAALCAAAPGVAQDALDPGELDPSAPMAPLPDLGVAWPDMDEPDAPEPGEAAPGVAGDAPVDEATTEIHYSYKLDGIKGLSDEAAILQAFRTQSALEQGRKKSANAAQISRRSRADADLLHQLLRSHGYYDAMVQPRIEGSSAHLEVRLEVDAGEQYRFASVELPGLEAAGEDYERLRESFAVEKGDPVVAEDVIAAGTALDIALGQAGFASATIGEQNVTVNHQTKLASLSLPVTPGPVAQFGEIRVSGEPPFDTRHVGVIARFKEGDRFRRSRVDDLRRALIATTLVSNADVRLSPRDDGRIVDVDVKLEPAPTRTIAGELGYGTGQGARLEASWTNRNFVNPEGALTLRGIAGTREQLLGVQFRRSNFRLRDQVLNFVASVSNQEYDAYEAKTARIAANIERQSNFIWHKKWTWTAGGEFLATDELGVYNISGMKERRTFLIAALPGSLGYDDSDSLLDPTTGFRLLAAVSPEFESRDGSRGYARMQLDASAYRPVSERVVVAGRVRFGTILGASTFDIAPSRRFY